MPGKGGGLTEFGRYKDTWNDKLIPELVPPTWRKIFEDQLTHVWRQASEALESATRVIVIGCSLPETDTHFKYLLAAGLRKNVSLRRILFIDPKVEALKERAKKVFHPQFIERDLVSFQNHHLHSATSLTNGVLDSIGRPVASTISHWN